MLLAQSLFRNPAPAHLVPLSRSVGRLACPLILLSTCCAFLSARVLANNVVASRRARWNVSLWPPLSIRLSPMAAHAPVWLGAGFWRSWRYADAGVSCGPNSPLGRTCLPGIRGCSPLRFVSAACAAFAWRCVESKQGPGAWEASWHRTAPSGSDASISGQWVAMDNRRLVAAVCRSAPQLGIAGCQAAAGGGHATSVGDC